MHKIVPAIFGCAMTVAVLSPAFATPPLESLKDKASYAIGLQLGRQMEALEDQIDINTVILGLQDGQAGREAKLSESEMRTVMAEFQNERQAKMQLAGEKNAQEAAAFLAENKTKEGIVTLDSGVQYRILAKGSGPSPQLTDTVSVHYRGTLIDGQEFDSSLKRGEPAVFPVNGVIPGWTEALQKMQVGSKWQLFIPADSAYGNRSAGPMIGPNTMLIFEVELLEIKTP